ncbi:MAG: protein translocase subunit SecF [Candidatus Falkowbacteria bacterium]|nr:protein translocase subunit SecF [Candidatus Falkowbacteria bacterium]
MVNFISKRSIWLSLSTLFVVASLVALFGWGFKLGIDFTGGSLLEVKFNGTQPSVTEVEKSLEPLKLQSLTAQPAEKEGMILRFQQTSEETHQAALENLRKLAKDKGAKEPVLEEQRFEAVGPSVGQELQRKAIYSIILVLLAISLYIAWAFRKVSRPVASWKYGAATLVALLHDVIIVLGFYALLGHVLGVEVNTTFVAAALTVLGFSVHDTIVVFDRIRENLPRSSEDFAGTVNTSLNQTVVRSINTSLTVLLVLASIYFLGGLSIKYFALSLLVGIFFGTYSSIFLASPLLVVWDNISRKRAK